MKKFFSSRILLLLLLSLACRLPLGIAPTPPGEIPVVEPTVFSTVMEPAARKTPEAFSFVITLTPTVVTAPPAKLEIDQELLSAGDSYAPQLGNRGYEVQQYDLKLLLDPAASWLEAEVMIQAASALDSLEAISLDFTGFDILLVTVDGAAADYERRDQKLLVALPRPLFEGERFTVGVAYRGTPRQQRSPYVPFAPQLGMFFQPEEQRLFVAAEPDGAHTWFPCNDHLRDKAAYQFELVVPQGLVGVALGELREVQRGASGAFPDGRAGDIYRWGTHLPVATAFVTVAVGDYMELKGSSPAGVVLRHYIYPERAAQFEQRMGQIGEMVDWMGKLYGDYPFEAFGYVMIDGLGASLETQTMVLIDANAAASEETLVHEMAHMWFGDWVSLDSWGEMWRSEGFATYTSALWESRADPDGLEAAMQAYQQLLDAQQPGYRLDNPPPGELFSWNIYLKGALLAHALRQEVGDEAFFNGLRLYFDRYGGGSASQAQFQQVLQEAAGKELGEFFESWFR